MLPHFPIFSTLISFLETTLTFVAGHIITLISSPHSDAFFKTLQDGYVLEINHVYSTLDILLHILWVKTIMLMNA